MSHARFARFLPPAKGDRNLALRLYIWNARLCEEFYIPLQFTEVALRNAIHRRLHHLFGPDWHSETDFTDIIPDRHKKELSGLVSAERARLGTAFTPNDVVAGLTFGFWLNLMSRALEHVLWRPGVRSAFPHLPVGFDRELVYRRLEQLRKFRNAVMHHYAIFDMGPTHEYQNIQTLLSWICPETTWLMKQLSNPAAVLQRRPRI